MTFENIGDLWRSNCRRYHIRKSLVADRAFFDATYATPCGGYPILSTVRTWEEAEAACLAHAAQNPVRAVA